MLGWRSSFKDIVDDFGIGKFSERVLYDARPLSMNIYVGKSNDTFEYLRACGGLLPFFKAEVIISLSKFEKFVLSIEKRSGCFFNSSKFIQNSQSMSR